MTASSGGKMASERAVPSDLFPLVLGFLRENHFDRAARAFGKAAGVVRPTWRVLMRVAILEGHLPT